MSKLLTIRSHTRRAPLDPFAEVKAAKTAQLLEEVALTRECVEALEEAFGLSGSEPVKPRRAKS